MKLITVSKSLFQNSVSFSKGFRKSGQKPTFPTKSKVAVPKSDILEQLLKQAFFIHSSIFLINSASWVVVRLHAKKNLIDKTFLRSFYEQGKKN